MSGAFPKGRKIRAILSWHVAAGAAILALLCLYVLAGWTWPLAAIAVIAGLLLAFGAGLRPPTLSGPEHPRTGHPTRFRDHRGRDLRLARRSLAKAEEMPAARDALTGLADPACLPILFHSAATEASSGGTRAALVAFDIDRLKDINGCFGFAVGDRLLIETAHRLDRLGADLAVRTGGDRFALLLTGLRDIEHAETRASQCLERITKPIDLEDSNVSELIPSASCGVAVFPDHGTTFNDLLQHTEMAVDTAKRAGGRRCCLFEKSMIDAIKQRRRIESHLKIAVENGDLHLVFQPQTDLRTGTIFGAEALMRWQDPTRSAVPPSVFIPVAEASGLIKPIGAWLIDEACRRLRQWRDSGLDLILAINISTAQLRQHDLVEDIERALSSRNLPPSAIELELTESLFVDPSELVMRRTLDQLARMGVQLAIDDFGTGFSSLAYLKRLPVSKIKIDKSFISGIGHERADEALVRTIIHLAETFGKTVLAEGVENADQVEFLSAHGCHQAQGYYFARPLSFDACTARVMQQNYPVARPTSRRVG